jgi:hypothetical protein
LCILFHSLCAAEPRPATAACHGCHEYLSGRITLSKVIKLPTLVAAGVASQILLMLIMRGELPVLSVNRTCRRKRCRQGCMLAIVTKGH